MKTLKMMMAATLAMAAALTGFGATATVGGVTYTYTVVSGMATITGVTVGSVTELTIPSTLGGYPVAALGADSFRSSDNDTENITSVVIPEGVINIGDTAFNGCFSLRSVVIPSSVMTIGVRAFINCIALTQVTLSPGVMTIGEYAFTGCSALAQVKIPASVKTLGIGSFSYCESLASVYFDGDAPHVAYQFGGAFVYCASDAKAYVNTDAKGFGSVGSYFSDLIVAHRTDVVCEYALEDGKATITRVHSNGRTVITLPSTLGGCPVAALGSDAFRGCSDLESVTIPSSVMTVGNYAFAKCGALASLNFDGNAPTCGEKAFDGVASDAKAYVNCDATGFGAVGRVWNGLETAYLPVSWQYSVTSGKATIIGVTVGRVTGVAIPATLGGWPVTKIGENAFDANTHDTENMTAVKIPEGVTTIGECAFNLCASLKSVTLPSSVTAIELGAFDGCYALTKVTIPSKVSTIGNYAFEMCYNLESVYFNGNAPTCGTAVFGGVASGAKAYVNADASGFGTVGSAWNGLTVASRTSVAYEYTAADNKATITGVHPNGQTEFVIPSTLDGYPVTAIGADAFDADVWPCANIAAVTISEGVTAIGAWAFYACTSLESVTIPASVETIGNNAFSGCSALEAVYFAGDEPTCGTAAFGGVASGAKAYVNTGASGFSYDGAIWNGLKVAWRGDVSYNILVEGGQATIMAVHPNGQTKIVIPATFDGYPVVAIGEGALAYNAEITSVVIPKGVKTIGFGAFRGCSALTQELTVDPGNAYYCVTNGLLCDKQVTKVIACPGGLTAVTIPEGVKTIGQGAFSHCASLKSVTIPASVETIVSGAFSDCSALESVTIREGVKKIDEIAFRACSALTSVAIPSSVEVIGDRAFYGCDKLKFAMIPKGVKKIGESAFALCSALASVTIPEGVEAIEVTAFTYCRSLKSVTIPASVKTIGQSAFYACGSLKSVTIPASVETIGVGAFASCLWLTSVYFDGDAPTVGADAFLDVAHPALVPPGTKAYAYVRPDAKGFGAEGTTWNGLTIAYRDDITIPAGVYASLDLVKDLGIVIPEDVDYAAGDKVTIKVEGLAKGLKLAQDKTSKAWIVSGVPTEEVDFDTRPMYARVTVTYKDKKKTADGTGKAESLQSVQLSITTPEPSALTAGVLNQVYAPVDIATLWPEVADAKVNPKEWSFKGWPAGLKYNATAKDASWSYKDGKATVKTTAAPWTVYGQPTKAGEYPITATHKYKVGKTTVSETFSAVLTVWGDDGASSFRYTNQAYGAAVDETLADAKSVSGLPTGLKFKAGQVTGTPTKPGVFAVTVTQTDSTKKTFLWKIDSPDAPLFALDTGTAPVENLKAQIVQGANQAFAIATSDIAAKVTVTGLPTGLKLVATPVKDGTKTIGNTYSVQGVATKPGEYFVTFKTVLNGVTTVTTTAFTVKGNPLAATYCGYVVARPADGAAYRLGVAEVTVAAAGTVKLTYTEGKTKYTANVKSFDWDDPTGIGNAEGLVLKVSSADKKLGYGDRNATLNITDWGAYSYAWLDIADANGSSLVKSRGILYASVKTTEVPLPASQTFVFQTKDGADMNALATVSVAYDAKKATAAFSGKLYDGTAVKATVPVTRWDDGGDSGDYVFAPFLVIAKDGTVYCFDNFSSDKACGSIDWVSEDGEDTDSSHSTPAEYTLGDKKFAALVPETGTFAFGWGSDTEVVGAAAETFAFKVTTDAKGNPAGVAIYDSNPQPGEKPLATVTAKVGKVTGAISVSFTSKKGDKAKYAAELVWRGENLFAGHVTRTWKGLVDNKSVNLTAYGTAEVK